MALIEDDVYKAFHFLLQTKQVKRYRDLSIKKSAHTR